IIPLGEWILEEACRAASVSSALSISGRGAPPGSAESGWVSVNLSAVQLADPGFSRSLGRIVRATGLSPHQLVLEVTESARLDQDVAAGTLRRVRGAGVRLAIDDFGTGYAALGQLARIPFDLVKIERSFVTTIGTDPRAEALVAGMVDLARRLNVEVVAEGIEDGVQLARLREAGCAYGQGFHFASPMPPAELATFLAEHAGGTDGVRATRRTRRSIAPNTT
ncbi:MAG TPA: EAL domain-containing protein, partial [Candidatus Limnocylindria bacterium]|nr:EAL domain-containing protein [Candidatus Limnocylindria bacterium]